MKILHNIAGVTAVEFAIILPVLLLIIMGSLEFPLIMFAQATLDEGVAEAARESSTQSFLTTTCTNAQCTSNVQSMIQTHMGGVPGSLVSVQACVVSSPPYTTINPCAYGTGTGTVGEWVLYRATYNWNILTPFMGKFFGKTNSYTMTATALVQNESCTTLPCIAQ